MDSVINDEESDDVTLTLSGVDADADSVTVTLTDGRTQRRQRESDNNGEWTVESQDGTFKDGTSRSLST